MFPTKEEMEFSVTVDVRCVEGGDRSFTVNTRPLVDSGVFADSMFAQQVLGRDAKVGIYAMTIIAGRVLFTPAPGVDNEERKRLREAFSEQAEQHFDALSTAVAKFPDSDLIEGMAEAVFNLTLDETLWGGDDDSDSERKLPDANGIQVCGGDSMPMLQEVFTREDRLSFFHPSYVEVYREGGVFHVGCVDCGHMFYTFITSELVRRVKESLERDVLKFVVRRLARREADRHRDQLTDSAIAVKYGVGENAVKEELRQIEEREEVGKFEEGCLRMAGVETDQPSIGRCVLSRTENDKLQAALDERPDDWEERSGGGIG